MNEYQPLDINRNPIGVLQPGKQYYIEGSGDSVELPEAGVYMLSVESGKVIQAHGTIIINVETVNAMAARDAI